MKLYVLLCFFGCSWVFSTILLGQERMELRARENRSQIVFKHCMQGGKTQAQLASLFQKGVNLEAQFPARRQENIVQSSVVEACLHHGDVPTLQMMLFQNTHRVPLSQAALLNAFGQTLTLPNETMDAYAAIFSDYMLHKMPSKESIWAMVFSQVAREEAQPPTPLSMKIYISFFKQAEGKKERLTLEKMTAKIPLSRLLVMSTYTKPTDVIFLKILLDYVIKQKSDAKFLLQFQTEPPEVRWVLLHLYLDQSFEFPKGVLPHEFPKNIFTDPVSKFYFTKWVENKSVKTNFRFLQFVWESFLKQKLNRDSFLFMAHLYTAATPDQKEALETAWVNPLVFYSIYFVNFMRVPYAATKKLFEVAPKLLAKIITARDSSIKKSNLTMQLQKRIAERKGEALLSENTESHPETERRIRIKPLAADVGAEVNCHACFEPFAKEEPCVTCEECEATYTDAKERFLYHTACAKPWGENLRSISTKCPNCEKSVVVCKKTLDTLTDQVGLINCLYLDTIREFEATFPQTRSCSNGTCYNILSAKEDLQEQGELFCKTCKQITCLRCGGNHRVYTCVKEVNKDEVATKSIEYFRKQKAKHCPNPACNFVITKAGGCAHMTCTKCGWRFEWGEARRFRAITK